MVARVSPVMMAKSLPRKAPRVATVATAAMPEVEASTSLADN
jgi:hypothetical protein